MALITRNNHFPTNKRSGSLKYPNRKQLEYRASTIYKHPNNRLAETHVVYNYKSSIVEFSKFYLSYLQKLERHEIDLMFCVL